MKAWFDAGFHLVTGSSYIVLDPSDYFGHRDKPVISQRPDLVLLTHAHSDHVNLISNYGDVKKVMHPATRDIMTQYGNRVNFVIPLQKDRTATSVSTTPRYKVIKFKDITIESFNAGHCIGSVQFKITSPEGSFVFTGDINTEASAAMQPAEILHADYVAIEATMGNPGMIAEPRDTVYPKIHEFIVNNFSRGEKFVVFYGQSIGKGQELTKLVNYLSCINDIDVFVDGRTVYANDVYGKYEMSVGKYSNLDTMPPRVAKNSVIFMDLYKFKNGKKTFASKLKLPVEPPSLIFSAIDENYPFPRVVLSSHADFNELTRYAREATGDRHGKILVFHGYHEEFSKHLSSMGYDCVDSHAEILIA